MFTTITCSYFLVLRMNYPPPVIRNPVIRNPVSQIPDPIHFLAEEIEILEGQEAHLRPRSVKRKRIPFEKYRCVPKIASPEARRNVVRIPLKSIVVYLKSPRRRRENANVLRRYRATFPRIEALSLVRGEYTTALQSQGSKNPGS